MSGVAIARIAVRTGDASAPLGDAERAELEALRRLIAGTHVFTIKEWNGGWRGIAIRDTGDLKCWVVEGSGGLYLAADGSGWIKRVTRESPKYFFNSPLEALAMFERIGEPFCKDCGGWLAAGVKGVVCWSCR